MNEARITVYDVIGLNNDIWYVPRSVTFSDIGPTVSTVGIIRQVQQTTNRRSVFWCSSKDLLQLFDRSVCFFGDIKN